MTSAQQEAVLTTAPHTLCIAGPGSGKTAVLVARIHHLITVALVPPERIVAITFTNAAARELEKRLSYQGVEGLGYCGTLHGFGLRMLRSAGAGLGYGSRLSVISPESALELLRTKAAVLGCKMKEDDLLALKAKGRPARGTQLTVAETVVATYFDDLAEAGVLDFDLILSEFARLLFIGGEFEKYTHLFVDEVQDSSEQDWAIYRRLPMEWKFFVGDPDQCQPMGTMVRMADGVTEKRIEDLVPGDKICTYARHEKTILKNGTVGTIGRRRFSGLLYSVTSWGRVSRCTGNHKWLVKWNSGKDREGSPWCTYLMRKGDWFRIGKTRMFRSGGAKGRILGVGLRMKQERADAVWILKIHATEQAAFEHEEITAANYGLPETCFVASQVSPNFTQPMIARIFNAIPRLLPKAVLCLQDHGRDLSYPLIAVGEPRTRRTVQEIHACNLMDDVMAVPIAPGEITTLNRGGIWGKIKVTARNFTGDVFSLDVPKYHKYIADGLVTCNSIYAFRGGDVDQVLAYAHEPNVKRIFLRENFRSTEEICAAANRLIDHNPARFVKNTVSMKTARGSVFDMPECANEGEEISYVARVINTLRKDALAQPQEPMPSMAILVRTNALAAAFANVLKAAGISVVERQKSNMPLDWAYARSLVELLANPDNNMAAAFFIRARELTKGQSVTDAALAAKRAVQQAQKEMRPINDCVLGFRGPYTAAAALGVLAMNKVTMETRMMLVQLVMEVGPEAAALDLALAMAATRDNITESQGEGVHILTVHAAKGREFDAVFMAGMEQGTFPPARKDTDIAEERRLAFVAITRARKFLYVSHARSRVTAWKKVLAFEPSQFIREALG